MGSANAGLLGQFFGAYYDDVVDSNWAGTKVAAFQMGVWDIVYEEYSYLVTVTDIKAGDFKAVPETYGSATALLNRWFTTDADNDSTPDWQQQGSLALKALVSPPLDENYPQLRDQIVVVPAPLTALASYTLCGLTGLVAIVRKGRKSRPK